MKRKYMYEERITLWRAKSISAAIKNAKREAVKYLDGDAQKLLDGMQAFWMYDAPGTFKNGAEVFSLIRDSDLSPSKYLKAFFFTGSEHAEL